MDKIWVKDVKEGDRPKSVYLVARKATPTSKSGKTYLSVTFQDRTGELEALRLLARAELGRGRIDAAERAAVAAASVAALAGTPADVVETRLLAGRVRARMARPGASDELRVVLAEVDDAGDESRRAEARIYLAEALVLENPIEAADLLAEARAMPVVEATPWLAFELNRGAATGSEVEAGRAMSAVTGKDTKSAVTSVRGLPSTAMTKSSARRSLIGLPVPSTTRTSTATMSTPERKVGSC
jgi:hypothetical protein